MLCKASLVYEGVAGTNSGKNGNSIAATILSAYWPPACSEPPQTGPIEQAELEAIQAAAEEGQVVGQVACAPTKRATPQVTVLYEYATLTEIPPKHIVASYLECGYIHMSK